MLSQDAVFQILGEEVKCVVCETTPGATERHEEVALALGCDVCK